ncbi:hypothetical protein B0T26DRAFT_803564 [Lasiosphaeria miniovina]|uniref:Uncharacterized protein n=1 Tax=Lasiosphaeria miniovina TaxID=1954250 RepID=A0AA40DT50_9PEZI|nr:uncharacterized protein B0T26DRAFT_803564 [Lasiosphaeria miniovina]KAK0712491.1 hypothetical protein B0T26DRAFT_803564 [Lasiosphaeria miniovina]
MASAVATNVTSTTHRTSYPAIDAARPELSQAGKTVLITGSTAGIGLAIAKGFTAASASTVIITGRNQDKLDNARALLEEQAAKVNTGTQIVAEKADMSNPAVIDALWTSLAEKGIVVDVLVTNIAKFAVVKPLLELGTEYIWDTFGVNVRNLLLLTERFHGQANAADRPKVLLNVSTSSIHISNNAYQPLAAARPEYALTKGTAVLALKYIAQDVEPEKLQIISFNPGMIFTEPWRKAGATEDFLPFDDASLPGNFAVWAASREARFLHGRYVWASWDVDELAQGELKKRLDSDVDFLRVSVGGIRGSNLA